MDGWLVGLFTLLGVLVGGIFTYLGLKAQLDQQKKISVIEWRRKVRSEPLLELRAELATMATKLEKLAKRGKSFSPIKTQEQENENLKQAESDWEDYLKGDQLEKVLYKQYDIDILNRVRKIRNEYLDIHSTTVTFKDGLSAIEFGKAARAAEEKVRPEVAEVQELINKKLEEL